MSREHEETCRAPDQTVGVTRVTASETALLRKHLVTSVTLIAHNKSEPSAEIATILIRPRQPFDQVLQFAALIELPDFVGATDVSSTDENARQGYVSAAEDSLKLVEEPVVHRHVALVDGDAEPSEDRSDGAAVVEGAANYTEARVVYDDSLVETGR